MRIYYAQNKEDLLIRGFFPDVKQGFYIDVGANDPVIDSVTKLLYDEGWSGINIEPITRHFIALKEQRQRDITLKVGLSDKPGELTFREYPEGDGLSTFDRSMVDYYENDGHPFPTKKYEEYTVAVQTLQEVVGKQGVEHIHFLKIDVEGYEYEVIHGYDWNGVRPELLCIEANHIKNDWKPVLKKHGYHEVFFDGVNSYFLAEESMHRKDYFDYPAAAFSGNPIYYPAFLEVEKETEEKAKENIMNVIEPQLRALSAKVKDQEEQIALLHRQQRDIRFLGKRFLTELQSRLHRRAAGVKHIGLVYNSDKSISDVLSHPMDSNEELLRFIHDRDKVNIGRQRETIRQAFRRMLWRVAAKLCVVTNLIMKKVAGRMM